jgi:hypothetical protein
VGILSILTTAEEIAFEHDSYLHISDTAADLGYITQRPMLSAWALSSLVFNTILTIAIITKIMCEI